MSGFKPRTEGKLQDFPKPSQTDDTHECQMTINYSDFNVKWQEKASIWGNALTGNVE